MNVLRSELDILQEADHPNIIRIFEAFEDEKNVHLVMEYCSGGDIFEHMLEKGQFNERRAAEIFEKVLSAVCYLHSLNICHRDIKPENFMFISKQPDADLKCIDFGVSARLGEGEEEMNHLVGTPHFIAPEVLKKKYGKECDVWSLGVMLYVLLSGRLPFDGKSKEETFSKILSGRFGFEHRIWKSISNEAKDLISRFLVLNPAKRITIRQAFKHPWFKILNNASSSTIPLEIFENLKNIQAPSKLRQAAMKIAIQHLTLEEIEDLRQAFIAIDVGKRGFITAAELQCALKMQGLRMAEKDMDKLLNSVNYLGSGKLNYTEFLIATMNKKKLLNEERLYDLFQHLDIVIFMQRNQGFITAGDLQYNLSKAGVNLEREEVIIMMSDLELKVKGVIEFDDLKRIILDQSKNYLGDEGSPIRCLTQASL
jgi:calcium-dependent protein kinase